MQNDVRKPYTIRLSDKEREAVTAKAQEGGETVSNWIRRTILAAIRKGK
jgi:predicted HicB family RNase H-like nuclease